MEAKEKANIDQEFKYEVSKVAGGSNIRFCFQCGKCEATCPIRRFEESYKPTQIIRSTLLGLKDKVLESNTIWLCATCYSCTERCPQGVQLTDVIRAIRNLAIQKGQVHPFFKQQAKNITKTGRIFEDEEYVNQIRESLGLPPLTQVNRDELLRILRHTNVKKLLNDEKEE